MQHLPRPAFLLTFPGSVKAGPTAPEETPKTGQPTTGFARECPVQEAFSGQREKSLATPVGVVRACYRLPRFGATVANNSFHSTPPHTPRMLVTRKCGAVLRHLLTWTISKGDIP